MLEINPKSIKALDVFLENRKSRVYVGQLRLIEKVNNKNNKDYSKGKEFVFEYDNKYLYSKNSIPLGPDIPLTRKINKSNELFKTLNDRIPSSKNPSYKEYCDTMGISTSERNPIILLSTIGKRGPSSFVFEPVYEDNYSVESFLKFRRNLGLTIREFATAFDFSPATIQRIEKDRVGGRWDSLKRIAIYDRFPEVALYELSIRGGLLHDKKREKVISYLLTKVEQKQKDAPKPNK